MKETPVAGGATADRRRQSTTIYLAEKKRMAAPRAHPLAQVLSQSESFQQRDLGRREAKGHEIGLTLDLDL